MNNVNHRRLEKVRTEIYKVMSSKGVDDVLYTELDIIDNKLVEILNGQ